MAVESATCSVELCLSLLPPVAARGGLILVVDDEESILELLVRVLSIVGDDCRVHTARNGQEALMKVQEMDYDLIICNVRMPVMDGLTFYRVLKESMPWLVDRMVFCTGDTVNPRTRAFFEQEAVPYIHKPFSIEEVIDLVRQRLHSRLG